MYLTFPNENIYLNDTNNCTKNQCEQTIKSKYFPINSMLILWIARQCKWNSNVAFDVPRNAI